MKKIFLLLMIMVVSVSACGQDDLYEVETFEEASGNEDTNEDAGTSTIENESTPANEAALETPDEEVSSEEDSQETSEETSSDQAEEEEREKIMAPEFSLTDRDGNEVTLEDYRGKIVFLNFFTTWCKYCDQEMPEFEIASKEYPDDVAFLLVDVYTQENVSIDEVYDWYDERDLTMDMVIDVEGALMRDYPIQAFPTTFFIDRDGSVLAYFPGAMTADMIDQVINEFK